MKVTTQVDWPKTFRGKSCVIIQNSNLGKRVAVFLPLGVGRGCWKALVPTEHPEEPHAEACDVLGEAGLLDAARRDIMIRMSKFRNVIVHDYARVDPTIVAQILREHLADFTRFKAAALKWIERVYDCSARRYGKRWR
jgi:Protein of unknown function DUF86